ncbi:hypothetical protein BAUCODRAFT_34758 [Baudoinia panamericana UAMH 10762]|uniref:Uncharacterized protein n=1 Tax=Baudoinia panamericana (strain UAMH 10762) TaxID=717646 RepID=M2NA48_BAUPA|nr:uncharacterized protein BAUCODRAFT_34758 [Baudoinia panamericana UAMH 10762]EMC95994.1 hypothetical protein BAUCODRAFT_34758 [Baudoinia panamericana UAMH 10762]
MRENGYMSTHHPSLHVDLPRVQRVAWTLPKVEVIRARTLGANSGASTIPRPA